MIHVPTSGRLWIQSPALLDFTLIIQIHIPNPGFPVNHLTPTSHEDMNFFQGGQMLWHGLFMGFRTWLFGRWDPLLPAFACT